MNELENYIHHYLSISIEDCKKVAGLFRKESLSKGDHFSKSNRYCDKLSFIQQGIFRVYVTLPEKEVTQWIGTPGYFITDISSFLFHDLSRWNIQALSDAQIFTIGHEEYLTIGGLVPKWNELEKLFIGKCFVMLENRIFSHLSLSAEERYQVFFEQNRELFNQVPLQYIASMLGMMPETLSRIRSKKSS
jgi:hypothetical protein